MVTQSALTATPVVGAGKSVGPRDSKGYKAFTWFNGSFLVVLCGFMLYPFVTVLAQSFSSAGAVKAGLVNVVPIGFNVDTYKVVIANDLFWTSYRNTVVYTLVGTTIAMILTTLLAFVLARKNLRGRNFLIGIAVFTMFFNGGLIPNYVLIQTLGLKNTMWAVVLPGAISVFNLLVMKSFFENMAQELEEAAQIDGLGWWGIFRRIVLPLSKAVLATMILFYSVAIWNDWFAAFLYIDRQELFPVTLYLRNMIAGASSTASQGAAAAGSSKEAISANIQAVTMILTIIPILCIYPFVQRYFVSGIMLGSVKG
ncbi:binding-protein-dependent transport systems inner membrane component [Cellulomonas flavigena DSM 20109]|uniref:Binding-protein-dependent transport systems inner membrane component n=1 Tax=Cellulomonas flavigena (strain ATCC 482 / DSM 20109 / BCRC 11376 / JCM 18109 / NBRC 3775 / NCIMB 8073 / NRS 134) TaxID=446466 RepID=D5UJQ1_CELFN|nr:binding-protein-dependent transport systems inner membrane component [Cellulomonas flavigena DSM 20109]